MVPGGLTEILNPSQRQVGETEANTLVLAGPGTGKTQVGTLKVGYLVATGRALPHEVLVLTFTKRAVGEFRQRMVELLGPEAGAKVGISTFHAHGRGLIEIGQSKPVKLLLPHQREQVLKELL